MTTKRFKLTALAVGLGAFAAGAVSAETVIFDNDKVTFAPTGDVVLGLDDYVLRADKVEMPDWQFRANLNNPPDTGAEGGKGSLTLEAISLSAKSFYSYLETSKEQNIEFRTDIKVSGTAEFIEAGTGIDLELTKQPSQPATLKNAFSIDAGELIAKGSAYGLSAVLGAEGSGPVSGALLSLKATAGRIEASGGSQQAVYANGNGLQATENEGTRVDLQAASMTLTGGGSYGGTSADNIAVFATQGAAVNLSGAAGASSLEVTTNQVNPVNANAFGNISLYSRESSINVKYGDNGTLRFDGGLFAMGSPSDAATIHIETGESSDLELDGNIIGVFGDVTLKVDGAARINAPLVMLQSGHISIDISADQADEDGGIVGNLLALYGDEIDGSGHIELKLSGLRNVFTGTSMISDDEPQYNIIDVNLKNGARWDVVPIEDENNYVTDLKLDGGTVNLPYGQAEGTYKQVDAATLSGTGGTINFNLALNGAEEANDKLVVQTTKAGSHTVHVDVHQGFEPTAMSGYLIHADADEGVTFTADDNPLEAGTYLYSYTVESKAGPEDGQKEWFITFGEYEEPLSPSGEAVAAMAGMGAQSAMYLTQLSDLRKRLGEVRSGVQDGLWASVAGQKDRIGGFLGTGFKQEAYRFNFGYDRSVGDWILGANLKAMTADQETSDGNFKANGDAHSEGVNIYASYLKDNGAYADFVLSVDRYHQSIDTNMLNGASVDGDYHNWGFGLSVELGHQFDFAKTWFVEPQAQLSYYYLEGDEFRLSNGMKIDQSNFDGLTARLGVASGKTFFAPDGAYKGQVYARLGVKHELLGDQTIKVNDIKFEDDLLGTRVYYGLGVDWILTDNLKFFGHVERENGSDYTKEFDFNVGVKYSF